MIPGDAPWTSRGTPSIHDALAAGQSARSTRRASTSTPLTQTFAHEGRMPPLSERQPASTPSIRTRLYHWPGYLRRSTCVSELHRQHRRRQPGGGPAAAGLGFLVHRVHAGPGHRGEPRHLGRPRSSRRARRTRRRSIRRIRRPTRRRCGASRSRSGSPTRPISVSRH